MPKSSKREVIVFWTQKDQDLGTWLKKMSEDNEKVLRQRKGISEV